MGSRVSDNGLYPPESYEGVHVYIVDDVHPDTKPNMVFGKQRLTPHQQKCEDILSLFEKHSDFNIHSVCFPKGTKEPKFWQYWENELFSKSRDDLIIVYYHGLAYDEEEDYTW